MPGERAIQTALLLLSSGDHKARPATCLVDLDLQHGACAHYLDLEPRLDLTEDVQCLADALELSRAMVARLRATASVAQIRLMPG